MKGDPYTLIAVSKWPETARQWAGKVILVLKNTRNGVTAILVFEPDGTPFAWPPGMEDELDGLAKLFQSQIVQAAAGS